MNKHKEISETSFNVLNFISFCSPIIVPTSLFIFTIYINEISKGLLYFSLVLGILLIRIVFLLFSHITINGNQNTNDISENNKRICNSFELFTGNNYTLSTYIISFTFFYLSFPMFVNNSINVGVIVFLLFYLIFDIIVKYILRCFSVANYFKFVIGDFIFGSMFGVFISCLMYYFGCQNLLFLTCIPSNNVTCSKPSKQTFKCSVYKNGQILSSQNI